MMSSKCNSVAAVQFVTEASATLKRRGVGKPEDVWLKSPMYPDYYLNTFHYQVQPCSASPPVMPLNPVLAISVRVMTRI